MNRVQSILDQYAQMRDKGVDSKTVLQGLRPYIEELNKTQRGELSELVRTWEERAAAAKVNKTPTHPAIRPLRPATNLTPTSPPAPPAVDGSTLVCPHCGKVNQRMEVFCYACGGLLEPIKGANETRNLEDVDRSVPSSEYFGKLSILALRVRGSSDIHETQPQQTDHELIVGRSTAGSAMMPDIDLKDRQAANLGVSRMHLAIHYVADQNVLMVSDLGSANGSYLNGQRLLPQEVRVLRHGDELRLGKLVLMVSFRHPA